MEPWEAKNWLGKVWLPALLHAAGLHDSADELAGLPDMPGEGDAWELNRQLIAWDEALRDAWLAVCSIPKRQPPKERWLVHSMHNSARVDAERDLHAAVWVSKIAVIGSRAYDIAPPEAEAVVDRLAASYRGAVPSPVTPCCDVYAPPPPPNAA